MNVVDSSGWLEYLADGPNASFFAEAIEAVDQLVVPVVSIFEVFKRVLQQQGEEKALGAVSVMLQGQVVDLDAYLALSSARASIEHKLPMADSIILATALACHAVLWTQDEHFDGLSGVRFVAKSS